MSFDLYLLTFALFRVWDINSGKTLVVYKDHTSDVMCVGIAPDGLTAITGSDDNTARYHPSPIPCLIVCFRVRTSVLPSILWVPVDEY